MEDWWACCGHGKNVFTEIGAFAHLCLTHKAGEADDLLGKNEKGVFGFDLPFLQQSWFSGK